MSNVNIKKKTNSNKIKVNSRLLNAIKEVEEIEVGKIKSKKYKSFDEALKDIK